MASLQKTFSYLGNKLLGNAADAETSFAKTIDAGGGIKSVTKVETKLVDTYAPVSKVEITPTGKTTTYTTPIKTTQEAAAKLTNNLTQTTATQSSKLSTILKYAGVAGATAVAVTAFGTPTTATPDQTVITGTDEDGNPTIIYQTGNEGIDEAFAFVQDQIDELAGILGSVVDWINSLFEGEEGSQGGYILGGSSSGSSGTTGSSIPIIPILIGIGVIVAGVYFYKKNKGKKSPGKSTRRKKATS